MTEKFKDYLTGAQFTVFTDNNPVAHLQTARLGAVEQCWVAQLASFDYDIKYRSGKINVNADSLSRFPVNSMSAGAPGEECETATAHTTAAVELTPEGDKEWASSEWEEAQASDLHKGPERQALSRKAKKLLQQWKKLHVKSKILCREVIDQHTHEVHSQIV